MPIAEAEQPDQVELVETALVGSNAQHAATAADCCGKQIKEILEWTKIQRNEIDAPLFEEAMSCCSRIDESTDEEYDNLLDLISS